LGLILGKFLRLTLLLLFLQMMGTFSPLIFFPSETWTYFPYAPSLEGQYIIKNLVLLGAGIVVGATVRGGNIIAEPRAAREPRQ
jgi:predicted permease